MATKHTCIQGDSYSYDFTPKTGFLLDADWTGQWAIVDKLGEGRSSLASGILGKNTETTKFEMRITPADTTPIAVGSYFLVVQVTNVAANFNKEIVQDVFKIEEQGI